jgi:hypothetical protein
MLKKILKKINIYPFLFKYFNKVDKRQRFILSSMILTGLLSLSTLLTYSQAQIFLIVIVVAVYFFTFFSVLEGIDGWEWTMLFLLPIYFTVAYNLFFFLLPGRWITRVPYVVIYAISIYGIMLSSNIFNVGEMKNLQLYKAASSVNFFYLILTFFLVFNLIFSFKLNFIFNFILIFLLSLPLVMQFYWSINPKTGLESQVKRSGVLTALIMGEVAMVFSFIPLTSNILALILTSVFYSIGGLFQAHIEERLFKERIQEFIFVLIFILIMSLFTINW